MMLGGQRVGLLLFSPMVMHANTPPPPPRRRRLFRTCNELNAGYAADGFCRRKGVGACVVTYGVGGYSLVNAAAGCFSEDLPVIFICGTFTMDQNNNFRAFKRSCVLHQKCSRSKKSLNTAQTL
jgi:thiamine pyrophosphate-dependent acetolactate synthase large subunit-like protein